MQIIFFEDNQGFYQRVEKMLEKKIPGIEVANFYEKLYEEKEGIKYFIGEEEFIERITSFTDAIFIFDSDLGVDNYLGTQLAKVAKDAGHVTITYTAAGHSEHSQFGMEINGELKEILNSYGITDPGNTLYLSKVDIIKLPLMLAACVQYFNSKKHEHTNYLKLR